MKKSSFLALALAPMIFGVPLAATAQSVSTDPVGFIKVGTNAVDAPNIKAGQFNAVGIPMVNPSIGAGIIESVSGTSVTVSNAITLGTGPHYLEITTDTAGDALVGERYDIASTSGTTINLDTSAASNSTSQGDLLAALQDATFVVRPHITISQINDWVPGGSSLVGSFFFAQADQIHFWTGTGFSAAHFNGTDWVGLNGNDTVIAPGEGVFFRRHSSGADLDLAVLGEVRASDFRQPLTAGFNFVALGYPTDVTPTERGFIEANGFQASFFFAQADQVHVWTGTGFTAEHLRGGSDWGSLTNFDAGSATFVFKQADDPDLVSLRPY